MTDPSRGVLEWAVRSEPLAGESASGDAACVMEDGGSLLIAAIDGLGHGEAAAAAAAVACETIGANVAEPLDNLLVLCHQAMQATRGAAMTLARVDTVGGRMAWVGVGNVDAFLIRNSPAGPAPIESPVLSGGIVGFNLPKVTERKVELKTGDLVVMATDGVEVGFADHLKLSMDVNGMADHILAKHSKGTDDALVLVARFRGSHG